MDTGNFLLECLPEELQQLLRKARQDPSRYLRDLFERLQSPEYQGYCTFHLFLDFYFQQFKTPPTGTVSFDNARAQIFALRGLYLAFCMGSKQLLKGKFESEWQTMWPWMNVLYRRLVVAEVWDKTHENYSMATMIESIMSTLLQPPINPKIVSTSGNVALMTDVYLYLGKHPPSDEDLVSRMRDASLAFLHLLSCPTSEVTEIRDVLGFHNEAAAKAFFQPLFMSIRGGPVWASTFRPLQRLHIQICHRNPTLYRDFPSKLVASYICEALSFFLDSASAFHSGVMSKGSDLNEIDESVTLVIGFLALYARHAAVGHAWMVHAMRYDLLPLLIRSAAHGKKYPGMLDGIVSIVDTIRFNSMHRPVLRRIISGPGNFSLPNTLTDRKVRMAWVQLQDATGFATAVHSELTLFQTFKPQCSNRLCGKQETLGDKSTKLHRCAGCKVIFYCSKGCQERDWHRHRWHCKSYRPERNLLESPATQSLYKYVMERDMDEQQDTVKPGIQKLLATPSTERPIHLVLDFDRRMPPSFIVAPTSELECPGETVYPYLDMKRVPLVLPWLRIRYGMQVFRFLVSPEASGKLFGWMK